jgi:hypothetical protein
MDVHPRNWPMGISLAALACGLVAIGMGIVLLVNGDSRPEAGDPTVTPSTVASARAGASPS